ncbi:hypothetical protein AHF37_07425 [Paragonimus kellicotti]|nr:hypothetical protein AHF37_07425 [Paragonimus kellicotti]
MRYVTRSHCDPIKCNCRGCSLLASNSDILCSVCLLAFDVRCSLLTQYAFNLYKKFPELKWVCSECIGLIPVAPRRLSVDTKSETDSPRQPRVTARSTSKDSESVGLAGVGSKSAPTPPAHSAAPNDTYTTSVTNSLEILHYDPQVNSLDDTLPMTIEASVSDVPEAGEPYDALGGPPSVLETHPFKKQSRIKTVKAKSELACARLDTHIGASGATKNLGVKGRLNKRPEAWRENNLALIQVIQSDTQILGERLRQVERHLEVAFGRTRNLIVHGIPEPHFRDSRTRVKAIKYHLVNLFRLAGFTEHVGIKRVVRVGKWKGHTQMPGSVRPVVVEFLNPIHRDLLLMKSGDIATATNNRFTVAPDSLSACKNRQDAESSVLRGHHYDARQCTTRENHNTRQMRSLQLTLDKLPISCAGSPLLSERRPVSHSPTRMTPTMSSNTPTHHLKKRMTPSGRAPEGSILRMTTCSQDRWMGILYTNACSIGNKWAELNIEAAGCDVVAVTETWLKQEVEIDHFCPPGMTYYRQDREDGRPGGGVFLLVANQYAQVAGKSLHTPNIQLVECVLPDAPTRTSVLCVYRSPGATVEEGSVLLNTMDEIFNRQSSVLLLGDLNIPEVDWERELSTEGSFGEKFLKCLHKYLMQQHVQQATRFRSGQEDSLLDLVVTRNENQIRALEICAPLGKSDHAILRLQYCIKWKPVPEKWARNYSKIAIHELLMQWEPSSNSNSWRIAGT